MKKVDFRALAIQDIEGQQQKADITNTLGNMLYMQGQNIEECELGRAIYKAGKVDRDKDSWVELTDEQVKIIRNYAHNFNYIIRQAILQTIE